MFKKLTKTFFVSSCILLALTTLSLAGAYLLMKQSLPITSGEQTLSGLNDSVTVDRDSLGIPTILASSRIDVAQAIGFLHAQDRFFQMDLMRRASAGELSELFGAKTIDIDKSRRLHQFRLRAREMWEKLSPYEKQLLESYTLGVNQGISALAARPFEYLILLSKPAPWQPEDTILVSLCLFFDLQDSKGEIDLARGYMKSLLPEAVYDFFLHNGSAWQAALDNSIITTRNIPNSTEFAYLNKNTDIITLLPQYAPKLGGSNHWAITGSKTADGKALLACDMHLSFSVPNIWYRAAFIYPNQDGETNKIYGATLPGTPFMIIGSNTHIAWGFTNGYIDTTDLAIITPDTANPDFYLTSEGLQPFETHVEYIKVKGGDTIPHNVRKTIWGPVSPHKYFDQPLALKWIAHRSDSLNMRISDLENVKTAEEALEAIHQIKIPILNFIVADSKGHIGWSLIGGIPEREGYDGSFPVSFADGKNKWTGALSEQKYPKMLDPTEEQLWTANNRTIGHFWESVIGKTGHLNGIRAHQIQQKLEQTENAVPADMLALQLDIDAPFMIRWQQLLTDLLKKNSSSQERINLLATVASWDGKASANSEGYYWIRRFHTIAIDRIIARFLQPCFKQWGEFPYKRFDFEEPVWLLLNQQRDDLINPLFGSWDAELQSFVDEMLENNDLASNWGSSTRLQMKHPLSKALPMLKSFLDMPEIELPGDYFVPRVNSAYQGASQRMVVSPGNEETGIFHSPGGQSGHQLSSHYNDGHEAWVKGLPTPFLPGKKVERLILKKETHDIFSYSKEQN